MNTAKKAGGLLAVVLIGAAVYYRVPQEHPHILWVEVLISMLSGGTTFFLFITIILNVCHSASDIEDNVPPLYASICNWCYICSSNIYPAGIVTIGRPSLPPVSVRENSNMIKAKVRLVSKSECSI